MRRGAGRLLEHGVARGLPPSWVGYRRVRHETLVEHLTREGRLADLEVVHPGAAASYPLPRNIADRDTLPRGAGWWGHSMWDVPERDLAPTSIGELRDCRVVGYHEELQQGDYHPAILSADGRALAMRELRFRPGHAKALAAAGQTTHLDRATWILERVYHNHSHWLTAHLPKLLLLRERDELDDVVLPERLTPAMEGSLVRVGLDPSSFRRVDPGGVLSVDRLRVVATDRFRPELLRMVREAVAAAAGAGADADNGHRGAPGGRKVYVSRAGADRRRLVNEDELWPRFAAAGFERVLMEELSFGQQVDLMADTAVLAGPHGAGLTNMVFCGPGTEVIEIADLGFPNPNFYAEAAGLGHDYWLIGAAPLGEGHPLERDLWVDPSAVGDVLDRVV